MVIGKEIAAEPPSSLSNPTPLFTHSHAAHTKVGLLLLNLSKFRSVDND